MGVSWIQLCVDIFDNRKIKQILRMPRGDAIFTLWIGLLCLAGKTNDGGAIYFTKNVPYDYKKLAAEFRKSEKFLQKSVEILKNFEMILEQNGVIYITNWAEYQNVEGLEKIREQTRQRVAKHRAKMSRGNVTVTLPVTECNGTKKKRKEENKKEQQSINNIDELNKYVRGQL